MVVLVQEFGSVVTSDEGKVHTAHAYASQQAEGTWAGWLVFFPLTGGRALPTDRETTQPNVDAVTYWASGLSPIYLEGALRRAIALLPEARLERRAAAAAREETIKRAEADAYERAAEQSRIVAEAAHERREDALETRKKIAEVAARK